MVWLNRISVGKTIQVKTSEASDVGNWTNKLIVISDLTIGFVFGLRKANEDLNLKTIGNELAVITEEL